MRGPTSQSHSPARRSRRPRRPPTDARPGRRPSRRAPRGRGARACARRAAAARASASCASSASRVRASSAALAIRGSGALSRGRPAAEVAGVARELAPRAGRSGGAARAARRALVGLEPGRRRARARPPARSRSSSAGRPRPRGSAGQVRLEAVGQRRRDQGGDRDVARVDARLARGLDRLGGDPLDLGRAAGVVGDEAAAPVAGDDQALVLEPCVDRRGPCSRSRPPTRPSSERSASGRRAASRPAAISARSRQASWTPTGSSSRGIGGEWSAGASTDCAISITQLADSNCDESSGTLGRC